MEAAIKQAKMRENIIAKSLDLSCNVTPWNRYGIFFSINNPKLSWATHSITDLIRKVILVLVEKQLLYLHPTKA